jgi:hypothetical protein
VICFWRDMVVLMGPYWWLLFRIRTVYADWGSFYVPTYTKQNGPQSAIYIDQYYNTTNFLDLNIEHNLLPTRLLLLMVNTVTLYITFWNTELHFLKTFKVNILWFYMFIFISCGLGSSVGIVTDYRLDGPGSNSGGGAWFSTRPDRPWGPPSLL